MFVSQGCDLLFAKIVSATFQSLPKAPLYVVLRDSMRTQNFPSPLIPPAVLGGSEVPGVKKAHCIFHSTII